MYFYCLPLFSTFFNGKMKIILVVHLFSLSLGLYPANKLTTISNWQQFQIDLFYFQCKSNSYNHFKWLEIQHNKLSVLSFNHLIFLTKVTQMSSRTTKIQGIHMLQFQLKLVISSLPPPVRPLTAVCLAREQILIFEFSLTTQLCFAPLAPTSAKCYGNLARVCSIIP